MSYRRELPDISHFTFGTGKVFDAGNPDHLKVVRAAMDAGVWFHTSGTYGKGEKRVYDVLRAAFREDPARLPRCIVKTDPHTPETIRDCIEGAIARTGMERVDVSQIITFMQPHSQRDLRPGCAIHDAMCALQEEGKVGSYVLELNAAITDDHFAIVRDELFDGYIFYYNVVQRFVRSNDLYDLLKAKGAPLVSLRTVGGGAGDMDGIPAERRDEARKALRELMERSGCADEIEFRTRFPLTNPQMRTTIGATDKADHLHAFIERADPAKALPRDVFEEIEALHRVWFAA